MKNCTDQAIKNKHAHSIEGFEEPLILSWNLKKLGRIQNFVGELYEELKYHAIISYSIS